MSLATVSQLCEEVVQNSRSNAGINPIRFSWYSESATDHRRKRSSHACEDSPQSHGAISHKWICPAVIGPFSSPPSTVLQVSRSKRTHMVTMSVYCTLLFIGSASMLAR